MTASPTSTIPPLAGGQPGPSREPLSPWMRGGLLAFVIFFHVGGGWALTQVEPVKLIVGDVAPMEVRMVPAAEPAPPEIPPAEEPPPPEIPLPELATAIEPPPPDLPPPEFPVEAKPPEPPKPPEKPKPPPPKPVQRPPQPKAPVETTPQQAAPRAPAAPRTVQASQLGYLVPPNPVYPARSRRAGEQGTATVRVLVDITGRPSQVSLQSSSGHSALDEAAISAVRASQFRPYSEGGLAQAVWVLVPIRFVLQ
ncbi:MAG: energy transducer TonB [Proteobacteria bacterium]|nr:energy transducer TonB [Pseudomonadota bacterium]